MKTVIKKMDSGSSSKVKKTNKTTKAIERENFIFKVMFSAKIYRVLEIDGEKSLYDFAELIIKSFKFEMDHCFGFFDKPTRGKSIWGNTEGDCYELFVDLEETKDDHPDSKSVKETKINDIFSSGKQMVFLFDYGYEWTFTVECREIKQVRQAKSNAKILKELSKGKAPEQYSECEDEE